MNTKKVVALLIATNAISILGTFFISKQFMNTKNSVTEETIIKEIVTEVTVEDEYDTVISSDEVEISKELAEDGWRIGGEFDELYVKDIKEHVIADNDFVRITYDDKIEYHKELNSLILYVIMENKTEYKIDMNDNGLEMNKCMLDVETYAESNKLAKAKCKLYIDAESIIDFDLTQLGEITGSMYLTNEDTNKRISEFDISIKL